MNANQKFQGGLDCLLAQGGIQLEKSTAEIAAYARDRSDALITAAGQPGYLEAVEAAADDVLLFAGGSAVRAASAYDREIRGFVRGALMFLAGG